MVIALASRGKVLSYMFQILYNVDMSRVVVVKWAEGKAEFGLDKAAYRAMLMAALRALRQQGDLTEVVTGLFPRRPVGMKLNCIARRSNSTPVALTEALSEILMENGVDENNIIIWERSNRELSESGYYLNAAFKGRRCLGTDSNGVGYSAEFFTSGDVNSLVSQILTRMVEYNINMPVLKDHSLAGMSGALKNMYGAIHNPNKYHGDNCNPYCAHVSNLAPIRTKNRLTVLDAVKVQYNGGPGYIASNVDPYAGVIVSDDPVACDRVGLEVLEHLRSKHGVPPLEKAGRPVKYLQTAQELGLGQAELSKIDLVVLAADGQGNVGNGELF